MNVRTIGVAVSVSALLMTTAMATPHSVPVQLKQEPHILKKNAVAVTQDPRVKIIAYHEGQVINIHEHYLVSTDFQFGDDEIINRVFLGDSSSWDEQHINNHVLVKAKKLNAASNMMVLTNKYTYHFMLTVSQAPIESNDQVVLVKFIYPQEKLAEKKSLAQMRALIAPPKNVCNSQRYNTMYSFTGNQEQAPLVACDDGVFTYLKFRRSVDLPAIFTVDATKHESVVNYRMQGNYVVVEKVAKELTLRNGQTVTAIYNDRAIGDWAKVKESQR